jgi:hypothetical protein
MTVAVEGGRHSWILKQNLMGSADYETHIRIVPICGIPPYFRPQLSPSWGRFFEGKEKPAG